MLSFWGIVTGVTVMLLAFGLGVYFLFVDRMRRRAAIPGPAIPRHPRWFFWSPR